MSGYERPAIDRPQILQYGDDVDMVHPTTWGHVYRRLERQRHRAWTTMAFSLFAFFATVIFVINEATLLAVFSAGFGAWFFRNYYSANMDYTVTWGGRRSLMPNLKVE